MNHRLTSTLILHASHPYGSESIWPLPRETHWLVLGPFSLGRDEKHQSRWWENREVSQSARKSETRFNPLFPLGLTQRSGGLLFSWCRLFARSEWHFSGKWNDSLVRQWAKVMQEECDGNDKVSKGAKMHAGRFDVVVLNSARDPSYLDAAQSLSFGVLLFSVCFVSIPICCKDCFIAMKACWEWLSVESEKVFPVTINDFIVSNTDCMFW